MAGFQPCRQNSVRTLDSLTRCAAVAASFWFVSCAAGAVGSGSEPVDEDERGVAIDISALAASVAPANAAAQVGLREISEVARRLADNCVRNAEPFEGKKPLYHLWFENLALTSKVMSASMHTRYQCGSGEFVQQRGMGFDFATGALVDLGRAYRFGVFEDGLWELSERGEKAADAAFRASASPELAAHCETERLAPGSSLFQSKPYTVAVNADGSVTLFWIGSLDPREKSCWTPLTLPATVAASFQNPSVKARWNLP
jgi:hypothetical protein